MKLIDLLYLLDSNGLALSIQPEHSEFVLRVSHKLGGQLYGMTISVDRKYLHHQVDANEYLKEAFERVVDEVVRFKSETPLGVRNHP